jgi:hypothetical protein
MSKGPWSGLISGLLLCATAAHAQDFPNRPIRIVVPFGAGGITDIIARTVAGQMSDTLGQQVIVENKPGAGNILATETVRQAPADGYTILLGGPGGMAINFMTRKNLTYKAEDFEPVAIRASRARKASTWNSTRWTLSGRPARPMSRARGPKAGYCSATAMTTGASPAARWSDLP